MGGRVVAVVKDLFFVARIRETARLAGARTPQELETALAAGPTSFVLMDLTTPGWDYEALLRAVEGAAPRPPVVAFTTHALAQQTKPLHARCERVVTKETLTRELGDMLKGALR